MSKGRVVVAMSGGVDSTVCACLMQEQGHEVIGVTLQLYDYGEATCSTKPSKTCCASKDIFDAQNACDKLGIKHYVLNYEDIFREEVIQEFADQYIAGYTPIPCVKCNQTVKFRDLFKIAKKLGAEKLITGHYVQKKNGKFGVEMYQGLDSVKDQSYFLFQTTKEQLEFLDFPLGGNTKEQTRELARKYGLEISEKPDSQNICFVPDGDYAKVVQKFHPNSGKEGNIVDVKTGKVLGVHHGIIHYTIGQRRGLGIGGGSPLYVCKLDAQTNTVFVGGYENLLRYTFSIQKPHFLLSENETLPKNITVRVRSSCQAVACNINGDIVTLEEKISFIAPGQAAVFYHNKRMIGGGYIEKIF
ncbi:MAG: tRNA-specific 2-thiouridylase [Candidatus Deianiraeaceae bacterium]|jgi:tRNA-specific 2-thiouridylase